MKTFPFIPVLVGVALLSQFQATAAYLPVRILLWPDGVSDHEELGKQETVRVTEGGDRVISNIHQPCIFPYLPEADRVTGTAVVIAPGGGHRELWSTHEGHNLARWLSERGVAAFVLYNRLAREEGSEYTVDDHALADTRRALQLVRSRAGEWGIQPDRIGVLGFSAGGELAALADMRPVEGKSDADDPLNKVSSKPDFVGLVYPGSSRRFEVTKDSAPVFIACGYNDRPDISRGMAELYLKYKEAGVPAELHVYASAGHGFGVRETNRGAVAKWPERLLEWMGDLEDR